MKYFKSFFWLTLLLLSAVTATAQTYEQGPIVTSADGLKGDKQYVWRVGGGSYITEANSRYEAPNAQNSITANAVFTLVSNNNGTWKVKNETTGNYWGVLPGAATDNFASASESNAGVWTFTFDNSNNIQAKCGDYYLNRASGVMHGWGTPIGNLKLYEALLPSAEQTEAFNKVSQWLELMQNSQALVTDPSNYTSNALVTNGDGDGYPALLDKNINTYFHTRYNGAGENPNTYHYLQANLSEAVGGFYFYTYRRNTNNRPTEILIQGSNDGTNFEDITTVSGNDMVAKNDYFSDRILSNTAAYKYLRFVVKQTNTGAKYGDYVFFTYSEFWLFPSNNTTDEAIALMKRLPGSAAQLSANQVADINRLDAALRSTTVNVTYELYKSDGTTLIGSETVTQTKNSAPSIPASLKAKEYYYDYAITEGTIGTSDCTIKVKRTLKDATIVENLADLSNDKVYYITTNENKRKSLSTVTVDGRTYLASDVKAGLNLAPKKFAIINYEDNFYLYSVDDQKFLLSGTGDRVAFADMVKGTTDRVTFTQTSEPLWMPKFNDETDKVINTSSSYAYAIVVNSWGSNVNQWDDGCQYTLHEAGDFDPADVLAALQEFFHPDPLADCMALATDVLNQVPYVLFPRNFNWDEKTEIIKDKNGKDVEVPVKGMSGADYNRSFKIYKNMAGKYQLASRLYVGILARLLEFVDADELARKEIGEEFQKLYEKEGQPWPGIEDMIAEALRYYARMVVESHGLGVALYEQNDPNYSPMFELMYTDGVIGNLIYWGSSAKELLEWEEATLSDIYEALHWYLGEGMNNYYNRNNYFGFNPFFLAHILNPNLENNAFNWKVSGFEPNSGKSLTDAESSFAAPNQGNMYDYLTLTGAGKGEASQTIQLPAGRYMLTVAGRASRANLVDKTYNGISGKVFDGPFTEAGAQNPSRYFQIFAKNAQGERAQSIFPQEGSGETVGVFGNGWNDASLFFTMPSVGNVTLGVRAQTDVVGAEASFTRFRLTRLGDATLFFDENQTYETELNWDPVSFFFATAPTDVVLNKQLTPGKWQSIAVPVDLSAEQLIDQFGVGTKLAIPTFVSPLGDDEKELVVNFTSWDIAASKEGLVQTKVYGVGFNSFFDVLDQDPYFYDYPTGMIANVPYLINPAKVSANNMYVFHEVTSSDTHGLRSLEEDDFWGQTTASGIWSWGGFTLVGTDEDGTGFMSAQIENPEGTVVEFKPNYKYSKDFPEGYTVEFNGQQKAFSAEFVCSDGYKVVSAMIDGNFEIVTDQLNDMLALGQSEKDKYPGIPTAMTAAMTFDPQVKGESGTEGFLLNYTDGELADDGKSWTTKDGKITLTADDETATIIAEKLVRDHFEHPQLIASALAFRPGQYTIRANNEGESIDGYRFGNFVVFSDDANPEFTFTKSDGEKVELEDQGFFGFEEGEEIAESDKAESALTFSFNGKGEAFFATLDFAFDLLYNKEFTNYNAEEFAMILDAAKNVRNSILEGKKAYPLSNEFNAAYAEAEKLLASEHIELEDGADAAFKELLAVCLAAFNSTTKAEDIPALTEKLLEEIAKYKKQIDRGSLGAGKYVFLNVGSGKYLGGGNLWGTQATLTTHGELMDLSLLEDGKYTIETRYLSSNEGMFGRNSAGEYYMDINTGAAELTIEPVERGIFTIYDGEGYLGYDGKSTLLAKGLTEADGANIQWMILSEDDLKALMGEVTVDTPMDVTHFIKNPNYSRNHRDLSAWKETHTYHPQAGNFRLSGTTGGYTKPEHGVNYSAEAWYSSFDVWQDLELPNGVYVIEAQGAVTDYSNAYDGREYPVIYGNAESSPFLSMEAEHRAKDMFTLQTAFLNDKYFVEPVVVAVTDGKLKVGAKGTRNDIWAIWDNFGLMYYGNANIDDVKQIYGKTTGNGTDGINTIDNEQLTTNSWYSIDGRKLNGKPTQKGLYIVNGKKVMVK